MRSKVADRILKDTPKEVEIFTRMYADIVVRINTLLKLKGLNQAELAAKMGKKPSEISKWLSGKHNLTLRSLAKLEAELGDKIMYVPKKRAHLETVHLNSTIKRKGYPTSEPVVFNPAEFVKKPQTTQKLDRAC